MIEIGKVYKRYYINHSCTYLGKPVTTTRIVKIIGFDKGMTVWKDVKHLHDNSTEPRVDELYAHVEVRYEKLKLTDILYG